ncbi:MAG: hypothetical protein AB7K24_09380 [Gemmataceae bacterium]
MKSAWAAGFTLLLSSVGHAAEVSDIKVFSRHGQTFVTWKDAAEGAAGAGFRYSLYRSSSPITPGNLARAELCYRGVLNHSARLYGYGWNQKMRQDPELPNCLLEEGGKPLPLWHGVAVHTVRQNGKAYYAVLTTDENYKPVGTVVPGKSATLQPVEETVAPIQPIKQMDSRTRTGRFAANTSISGQKGLPLTCFFHGSSARGAGPSEYGDFWIYFGTPDMGYRDGITGGYYVLEGKDATGNRSLQLRCRDSIEHPGGDAAFETLWFGYLCVPPGATHKEPRAYPFTERRLLWILEDVIKRYQADPQRVYSTGQSMGGMCSTQFAFRHPEVFAAVYPLAHNTRQFRLARLDKLALQYEIDRDPQKRQAPMADGTTDYFERMDMVKFGLEHHEDLPFYGWAYGRQDRTERWQCHVDMARALAQAKHGFAFAWNDGNHGGQGSAMQRILPYYPQDKFARNRSYPAFRNSSIDDDPGKDVDGSAQGGALEGGINLGFVWKDTVDQPERWSVQLSNDLARAAMTVDVTPRRCQQFKLKPGEKVKWTTSTGGSGTISADAQGLATVEKIQLLPGRNTLITLTR